MNIHKPEAGKVFAGFYLRTETVKGERGPFSTIVFRGGDGVDFSLIVTSRLGVKTSSGGGTWKRHPRLWWTVVYGEKVPTGRGLSVWPVKVLLSEPPHGVRGHLRRMKKRIVR